MRSYALTVPSDLRGSVPLVIALHGLGGSGQQLIGDDGWSKLAPVKGFIVAGPDALPRDPDHAAAFGANPRMWRTGDKMGGNIDDVAFVRDLISTLEREYPIDRLRIYVVGHSNGGGMTFRMAMSDGKEIAAIGTVASQVPYAIDKPVHPMPTICFMGTDDPLIPPQGGSSKLPGTRLMKLPPASEYLGRWAVSNGYPAQPQTVSDDKVALVQRYGADFVTWLVKGQGHAWPGGEALKLPQQFIGPQLHSVDATSEIWAFISSYRLR